jgi:hypothetical protein
MRARLLAAICLLSAPLFGTVPLSGHLKDLSGNPVPGIANQNFARFRMIGCDGNTATVPGVGTIDGYYKDVVPNNLGVVSDVIYGNNEISCNGNYITDFTVTLYLGGKPQPGSQTYYIGALGFNFDAPPAPINPSNYVPPPNAVITNPSGSQTVVQPNGSALIISGNFQVTGTCTGCGGGGGGGFYQTLQNAGSAITQRATLNWTADIFCSDNAGSTRSDCSLDNIVTAGTNTKITYNAKGRVTAGVQAQFSDIGGTVGASQLPTPGASSLGGVQSKTCTSTDKISAIGTDGIPVCSADQTGAGGSGYATIQNAAASITQRTVLNWTADIFCSDNAGSTRSDCSLDNIVTAGTNTKITYNAKGRVTAGAACEDDRSGGLQFLACATNGQVPIWNTSTNKYDCSDPIVSGAQPAATTQNVTATGAQTGVSIAGYGLALFTIRGTYGGYNANFEATPDGTNWFPIQATRLDSAATETATGALTNTTRSWLITGFGMTQVRQNVQAFTSGTANTTITPMYSPITAWVNAQIVGTPGVNLAQYTPVSGRLPVDPSGVTQPISAASLPLPSGASQEHTTAASPNSARLSDGAAFYKATTPADTQPISAASLPLPSGAAQDRTTAASPSSARLSDGAAFYKATTPADTQPISAASLPLPSGASQEHTTAGSPTSARLTDGSAFYKPTTPADTQPISVASLPLPTGAAQDATLTNRSAKTQISNGTSEADVKSVPPTGSEFGVLVRDPAIIALLNLLSTRSSMNTVNARLTGSFGRGITSTGDALDVFNKYPQNSAGCAGSSASATQTTSFGFATATNTKVIPAGVYPTYICADEIVVGGADNVALVYGTKTTTECDTGTTGMSGGNTAATGWNFAANGGKTHGNGVGILYKVPPGKDVCLFPSAAVQASGSLVWVQQP